MIQILQHYQMIDPFCLSNHPIMEIHRIQEKLNKAEYEGLRNRISPIYVISGRARI